MTFSVHEAKTQLSKLLNLVQEGEEVVITKHGKPVAQVVAPPKKKKKVVLGFMQGEGKLLPGWDKPMTDEEADAWLAGE